MMTVNRYWVDFDKSQARPLHGTDILHDYTNQSTKICLLDSSFSKVRREMSQ